LSADHCGWYPRPEEQIARMARLNPVHPRAAKCFIPSSSLISKQEDPQIWPCGPLVTDGGTRSVFWGQGLGSMFSGIFENLGVIKVLTQPRQVDRGSHSAPAGLCSWGLEVVSLYKPCHSTAVLVTTWHPNPRQQMQNREVGLHKTKRLLHNQGNHQQNEKAAYRLGKYVCKPLIS